jgi:hypothetical protein
VRSYMIRHPVALGLLVGLAAVEVAYRLLLRESLREALGL